MGSSTKNRITYLEPNNLPGEFAAKSPNNVMPDNITWAPEDLNITVDLQVVIPSRKYRKSNASVNYNEALLEKQSILSGAILDRNNTGETFLTTDYTNVSYQEIKNNNAGSKELLGINSINIIFDSHMYPRVTMNFTDVRGSALMMPQEQYTYDMAENKITGKDNPICTNFFQAFFKFPYPQFLLSVKGVYGTCVTFVLSVEDFKATFNSETGNFDVVVKFIGLMYGLYTDIPMNYLMMAPYIWSANDNITNEYWNSKTQPGGEFFFHEKDGSEGRPISTFFEFVNNYKNLISLEQGGLGFLYGPNIAELKSDNDKIGLLEKIKSYYDDIKNNIKSPENNKIDYREVVVNGLHFLFLVCETPVTSVAFNEGFVKNFSEALSDYENEYGTIITNKDDVPGRLSHYNSVVSAISSYDKNIFISKNNKYEFDTDTSFYKTITKNYPNFKAFSKVEETVTKEWESTRCAIVYDETFKDAIITKIGELNDDSNLREESASKEMVELFKNSCNFTPTIENVMRMIFAHLDTFLHEFYSVLESIEIKPRRFGKEVKWNKSETDVMSPSEDSELPPFAAFYKKKNGHYERTYPSPELKNLEEIIFVENILNGLSNKLKNEAIAARARMEDFSSVDPSYESFPFTPIAITDYFYDTSPYSYIDTNKIGDLNDLIYFILCRIYVAFRDFDDKDVRYQIIDREFLNFKNSNAWTFLLSQKDKINKNIEDFKKWIDAKQSFPIFKLEENGSYKILREENGDDYFKFNGLNTLRQSGPSENGRESLKRRFRVESVEKINEFKNACAEYLKREVNKKSRIDLESVLRRDLYIDHASILVLIDGETGKPLDYYKRGEGNKTYYMLPSEKNIVASNSNTAITFTINDLFGRKNDIWVPAIFEGNTNIFFDKGNPLFNDSSSDSITPSAKAAWFLTKLIDYEKVNLDLDFKHDHIFHLQKAVLYLIGAYCTIKNVDLNTQTKSSKKVLKEVKNFVEDFYPNFLTADDEKYLKGLFVDWVNVKFMGNNGILQLLINEIDQYNDENKPYNIWANEGTRHKLNNALAPNTPLQELLIELINDDCYVMSFPKTEKEGKDELLSISVDYVRNVFDRIKTTLDDVKDTKNDVEDSQTATNVPINVSDDNLKNSLYYTLKNLYDRWLSIYSYENFKLDRPGVKRSSSSRYYSEFNNFLYVDSFYNDISTDFMINPKILFNIVNAQIAGDTNFNILEFIGKICQDNKLLFRCLPVYDNLYSADTFKDIFRPLSLYNGADKLHRRIGNTYLIMYPYEPSNKLNILQDKKNDVTYQYDSFNFADSFGRITDEATNLFKEGAGENICAFGVTPGAQNQSYFTKVSIGMDNPRVTDYAIRNKFALANAGIGGRSEAEGVAQDLYPIYSNRSYDCNVEMLGCANIMPMMYFQLNNVPMFNGAYMITKVEHNIQNNTMTTRFTGTRMSRYYIPYNKSLFALQELFEIINRLSTEGGGTFVTMAGIPIKIDSNGNYAYGNVGDVPKPDPNFNYNRKFNLWAAQNQMAQCYSHSGYDSSYRPMNYSYEQKKQITGKNGYCATAVEMFLMAGFFGLFCAGNGAQGSDIDSYRRKLNVNGVSFNNANGYEMKQKLADLGFQPIACGASAVDSMAKDGRLQTGDVCVMRYTGGRGYGHVCMYTGTKWVSDYSQNGGWKVGGVDTENTSSVILYRYPNVETNPRIYCYYEGSGTDRKVENYKVNDGYVSNPEAIINSNVVE